jgi:hypothetical protein
LLQRRKTAEDDKLLCEKGENCLKFYTKRQQSGSRTFVREVFGVEVGGTAEDEFGGQFGELPAIRALSTLTEPHK